MTILDSPYFNQIPLPKFCRSLGELKVTLSIASTSARLIRCIVFISNKAFSIPPEVKKFGGATYFVSAIRIPVSLYELAVETLKIRKAKKINDCVNVAWAVFGKGGVLCNDAFHVLKGLAAFSLLDKRFIVLLACSPSSVVFGALSFFGRLYANVNDVRTTSKALKEKRIQIINLKEEKAQKDATIQATAVKILTMYRYYGSRSFGKKDLKAEIEKMATATQKLNKKGIRLLKLQKEVKVLEEKVFNKKLCVVATTLDLLGVATLSFTPLFIPGYATLGISAVVSLVRNVYNSDKSE